MARQATSAAESPPASADSASALFDDLLPGPVFKILGDILGDEDPTALYAPAVLPERTLLELHTAMVLGRAVESAATSLAKQGSMSAYPSARGQEASQVGVSSALAARDWLFPTYRDSIAVLSRGVDPVEVLAGPLGYRHAGYDPYAHSTAAMCTPLATHAPHAVGFAYAARYRGHDTVVAVLLGDGATSEGDFHAALNFAAVLQVPVVFIIQNNQYAISTPIHKQSVAPSLAHKGIGYGIPSARVDGNDVLAVHLAVGAAVERARRGGGPALIEAMTYRVGPHTTSDDPSRYRSESEADRWGTGDPVRRYTRYLKRLGVLTDQMDVETERSADDLVTKLRLRVEEAESPDPADLVRHAYAEPPATLLAQVAGVEGLDA